MKTFILLSALTLTACDIDCNYSYPIPAPPEPIVDEVIGYGELIVECEAPSVWYPSCYKECVFNYLPPTELNLFYENRQSFAAVHTPFNPVTDNFNDYSEYNRVKANPRSQFMVQAGEYNVPTLIIYGPYCGFGGQYVTFHIDAIIKVEDGGITHVIDGSPVNH